MGSPHGGDDGIEHLERQFDAAMLESYERGAPRSSGHRGRATRSGEYRTQFVRAALDLLERHEVTVWFLVTPANIVSARLPHEWPGTRGWDIAFDSPRRLRQRPDKIQAGAVAAAA